MRFKNSLFVVFFIIFLCGSLTSNSYSQTGIIQGSVVNSNGNGLYRANVEIIETGKIILTDSSGKYSFDSLASQKYTLKISKSFYKNKETETNATNGQATEVPKITLIQAETFASVENLPSILQKGDIAEYSRQIEILANACKFDKSEDCRIVNEVKELIVAQIFFTLESKTTRILFNAGIPEKANISKDSLLLSRGILYFEEKQYYKAIGSLEQSIEINPSNTPSYYYLGNAQLANKDYADAVATFSKSIEFEPTATFAYTNRGNAYIQLGNFEDAILDYTEAIKLNPFNADLYKLRAIAYEATGDKTKASADRNMADSLKSK